MTAPGCIGACADWTRNVFMKSQCAVAQDLRVVVGGVFHTSPSQPPVEGGTIRVAIPLNFTRMGAIHGKR